MSKLVEDASIERFDAAALRPCELIGDGHLLEVDQRVSDGLEPGFEGDGHGGERRRRLGLQASLGVAEQLASVVVVGDAIGADQGDGFVAAQPVALDGADQGVLLLVGQGTERVGEGGADLGVGQLLLGRGAEVPADVEAAGHPARALAQEPGDLGLGLAVVVDERADDPRFVEGGHGTWRGVGAEQQALVLLGRGRPLDHDRHELAALLSPASQALEAVDDLIDAVVGRRDAQGHLGPLVDLLSRGARSQRSVGGAEMGDGYVLYGARDGHAVFLGSHDGPVPWRRCRRGGRLLESPGEGARSGSAQSGLSTAPKRCSR